jgi:D-glycero-D-manno-heptose 1,7-bisphosphate phosphatase
MNRAVFLDRDGVINRVPTRGGQPVTPRRFAEFEFVEGIADEVGRIKAAGFLVFVITNQPDVARGLLPLAELERMSAAIRSRLPVDAVWVCPHDDGDRCSCRKPKPGMIERAREKYAVDIGASFLIGDSWKDMELASRAGCRGILIDAPYNQRVDCYRRVRNVRDAVDVILAAEKET